MDQDPDKNKDKDKELSKSQIAGGLIGATVGVFKGMSVGISLGLAATPFLGPFAAFIPPAVGFLGAASGWRVGSKGLSRAAMLVLCAGIGEVLPTPPQGPTPDS